MFTGLVTALGKVLSVKTAGTGRQLWIESPFDKLVLGESIACDGVCLTVEDMKGGNFQVTAGKETIDKTTWAHRGIGHRPHLERALALGDRLGGHIVAGHVDGIATIASILPLSGWTKIVLQAPPELAHYIATKGSVCLDGMSLTVNEVDKTSFSVGIIPHTELVTRVGSWKAGDPINLEVDLIARYLERLLQKQPVSGGLTMETLKAAGFV